MANDLGDWFRSIPQITRYWFAGSIVLPLLGRFGLVTAGYMIMSWNLVLRHFQIWRPISAIFYYPITPMTGFHYLMTLYFLYSYSTRLESGMFSLIIHTSICSAAFCYGVFLTGLFDGRRADYMFLLSINWLVLLLISVFASIPLLMEPLVFSVLYIWCQINKDTIVQFWFGTQFKAMYMPWILLAFNMIIRGGHSKIQVDMPLPQIPEVIITRDPLQPLVSAFSSPSLSSYSSSTPLPISTQSSSESSESSSSSSTFNLVVSSGFVEIIGILVGHVYYFLKYRYPAEYGGTDFLQTPKFMFDLLPNRQGGVAGFGMPPAYRFRQDDGQNRGGHNWGRGNVLGN